MYEKPDTLKQLIRTGLVAKEGHVSLCLTFQPLKPEYCLVCQTRVLDVVHTENLRSNSSADVPFRRSNGLRLEKPRRQRHAPAGKVATLALGCGPGALKAMGALEMVLKNTNYKT